MKKLLLHACCGPCATAVIEQLKDEYEITVYYYNPNTEPEEEYRKRLDELVKVCKHFDCFLVEGLYDNDIFQMVAQGLEEEPEGGRRCLRCFELRLVKTAGFAKDYGFDCFDTTLTVSPHKNSDVIIAMGKMIGEETGIEFLGGNYKKNDGYKRSCDLSKELDLYRQNYCGCHYSNWNLK